MNHEPELLDKKMAAQDFKKINKTLCRRTLCTIWNMDMYFFFPASHKRANSFYTINPIRVVENEVAHTPPTRFNI